MKFNLTNIVKDINIIIINNLLITEPPSPPSFKINLVFIPIRFTHFSLRLLRLP